MAQSKYQKTLNMPLSKLMALSRKDLLAATELLTREGNKRLTVMKKKGLVSASPEHIKIWLDDVREAPEGYFRCKSVNEAKRLISACEDEATVIDVIDCDHDLGDYAADGGEGISLIDWLAERGTHYPIEIHTMNPVGRENMQREIDRYWNER